MIIILLVKVQWLRRLPCSTGYSVQKDELVSLSVHVCGFTGMGHSNGDGSLQRVSDHGHFYTGYT